MSEIVEFFRPTSEGRTTPVLSTSALVAPVSRTDQDTPVSTGVTVAYDIYARSRTPTGVREGDVAVVRGQRLLVVSEPAVWHRKRGGGHVGDVISVGWKKG